MQGSVCFLYVNVVDPRPCLLNAKLIDRTITAIFLVPINWACLQRYLKLDIYFLLYVEL